ncbi:MAG: hypothetical protein R3B96_01080 [Pirellulaceae bacterium]
MPSSCNDDHDETEGGDVAGYNRRAWDRQVDQGNRWTVPVDTQRIAAARRGDWSIVLTPERAVPRTWFPRWRIAGVGACLRRWATSRDSGGGWSPCHGAR